MKKVLIVNTQVSKEKVLRSMLRLLVGEVLSKVTIPETQIDTIILECKSKFERRGYQVVKRDFTQMSFDGIDKDKPEHFEKYATYITYIKEVKQFTIEDYIEESGK